MTRYKNLYGQVLDELGRQIVAGAVVPGQTLPAEPVLCERFGVSRVVVREAIKSLTAKGLVTVGPSIGTRVRPTEDWHLLDPQVLGWFTHGNLDARRVADLIELRRIIEPQAARLAARRATPADLAEIRGAYERMVAAVEGDGDYVEADTAFHGAILAAAHNQFLAQLEGALEQILALSFSVSSQHPDSPRSSLAFHEALAARIEAGDADGAAQVVDTMISRNDQHLQRMMAALPVTSH